MDVILGYLKYTITGMFVGMLPLIVFAEWQKMLITGAMALFAGFMGATGGFVSKLLTNWLKRKWKIFRTKN